MNFIKQKPAYLSAIICVFAVLLYANTFQHGFVFDDSAVLSKHVDVQQGASALGKIFTVGSWQGFEPESDMHIYRPMQLSVLALQYELFGLNPMGYHIVHVLSYMLLCYLIFALLRRLFSEHAEGLMLAFIATLIFAAHPVHTEVVANIKGNGDLLAMLFGILALHCLHRYTDRNQIYHLAIGALCFFIALLTKETIVSFVGVGAFVLYYFSTASYKRIALSLLPMLAMVILYLTIRSQVFGADSTRLTDTSEFSNILMRTNSLSEDIGTRFYALGKNLQLVTISYPLLMMYVYNSVPHVDLFDIRSIFSFAAYIAIGITLLCNLKRGSIWGFAAAFYLTSLALFSNTVFTIPNIVSERWLLIPSLAVCIATAYALIKLHKHSAKAAIGIFLLIMIGYSGHTIERNLAWKSNLSLGTTDAKTAPNSVIINRMAAVSLIHAASEDNMNPELLKEAAEAYERMVIQAPNDAAMFYKLGQVYEALGDYEKATETFEKSASFISDVRASAELSFITNANRVKQYQRATLYIDTYKLVKPHSPDILFQSTLSYQGAKRPKIAQEKYEDLIDAVKSNSEKQALAHTIFNNLGIGLEAQGSFALATQAFGEAASYDSKLKGKAQFSQAKCATFAGEFELAIQLWNTLDKAYPDLKDIAAGMVCAHEGLGQTDAAKVEYQRFKELLNSPTITQPYVELNKLGLSLEAQHSYTFAADVFTDAASYASSIKGHTLFSAAKNLNHAKLYEQALAQWQIIDQQYPNTIDVQLQIGLAHEGLEDPIQAKQAYQNVLSMVQQQNAYLKQGKIRREAEVALHRIAQRIQDYYTEQVQIIHEKRAAHPELPLHNDFNNLALKLEAKGAYKLAAHCFNQAASEDSPIKGKALFSEVKNLNSGGHYIQALPKWQALDKAYPNVVDVLMGKATAHEECGDSDSAKTDYQKALSLITPANLTEQYSKYKTVAEAKLATLK